MNVIFLDIDGVLNNADTKEFTPSCRVFVDCCMINNLKKCSELTNAKIVLSSDWRYNYDDPNLNEDYLLLVDKLKEFKLDIFDVTPIINNGRHRGTEIKSWLDNHSGVEHFVIIDDRYDMDPIKDHLVRTNPNLGLTHRLIDKVVKTMYI